MAKHGAPFKMTGHTLPGPNQSPMKQRFKKGKTTTTTKKHTVNVEHQGIPGDSQRIGYSGTGYPEKEINIEETKTTPSVDKKGRTRRISTSTTSLKNPQATENWKQDPSTVARPRGASPEYVETTKTFTKVGKSGKKRKSISATYNPDSTVKGDKVAVTKYDKEGKVKKIKYKKATKRRLRKVNK